MKKALAGIFVVALLVVVAVPVFAAPPWARGTGGSGRGLGTPIAERRQIHVPARVDQRGQQRDERVDPEMVYGGRSRGTGGACRTDEGVAGDAVEPQRHCR